MVLALAVVWFLFWVYRENYFDWLPLLLILSAPWLFSFLNNRWTDWERLLIPLALCLVLTHSWYFRQKRSAGLTSDASSEKNSHLE